MPRVDLDACRIAEEVQGFCRPCNLSFNPDGTLLAASRGGCGGFGVHRFPTGELLFKHAAEHELQTSDAIFSQQGGGTVGLWFVTD
ncbi:hypothetical protein MXAN_1116 [Myxococcus xanthus DK 1622]|uniref:Uncharacterized protein n=1 Tax=Myxococcus xanthus (strain DK1622) TaxID=246197 RepID=Q1DD97_MYXXD|nr:MULTISPECIES: hypothetical protein [Myxococcus]ABF88438.1 hypothetical protein MXAN_1116 [Myxococcus xanthus DK 1622]NOJ57562.1 hypothetical protein [Myxococcus xanthus]QPM80766.1 hypothetical protein I5Q59_05545 [Myxococcus xanthus]QVW69827.1 hypothetical protein JTM82_09835 [Myxococcus xanthus DZ2]QZZ48641.1 hypothetical protein MyxoNM_05475 [Myxococcus xanthus]